MSKQLRIWLFVLLSTLLTSTSLLAEGVITMTTSKKVGETIQLSIMADSDVSISSVRESARTDGGYYLYTLTSQTITIRGDVTKLDCYYNQLTSLDVSGCTVLTTLDCRGNQLTSLDVSKNTALTALVCYSNQLTSLDVSGFTALTTLSCHDNQLTSLNVSSCTALTTLECESNPLTRINLSNCKSLEKFSYKYGKLTSLDVSGCTSLTTLECYENKLTSLDVSSCTVLTTLECSSNQLTSLDVSGCTALTTLNCYNNQLTSLDVSGFTALTTLSCSSNQLTTLDVSGCTSLTKLNCYYNQLTRINLSGCQSLKEFSWTSGKLTSLDVSGCTSLTTLKCRSNQLTSLDLSGCTALTTLDCYENQLTSLDLSGCTALTKLDCSWNSQTSLNVSDCTSLTTLDCRGNQLTSLDVSGCIALTTLDCRGNQLTSLNLSGCTALTTLEYESNPLTSVNLSGCQSLKEFSYTYEKLTSLDVSDCTSLTKLNCYKNQLTSLDVSGCTALTELYCHSNGLTSLDVSGCTALITLNCSNNQLTSLDLSKNVALTTLNSSNNQLTSLDLSKNVALTTLYCGDNQLTSLDVSKNTALTTLDCSGNLLRQLNVEGCTNLSSLSCFRNEIKGTEMTNLVNSLPDRQGAEEGSFHVFREVKYGDVDGNGCLATHVATAKAKNWRTLFYRDDKSYDYAGLDKPTFVVTYSSSNGGSISITGADDLQNVPYDTELTVTETNVADGYKLTQLTANGQNILKTKRFKVTENTEVMATFTLQAKAYNVTIVPLGKGTIQVSGADDLNAVTPGTELTITATPDEGYELTELTANGQSILDTKKVVVNEDLIIKAVFKEKTYRVSLDRSGDGTLYVSGADDLDAVKFGTELTITADPAEGYELTKLTANDNNVLDTKKVVVNEDMIILAIFSKKTFKVSLEKQGNGTLRAIGADDLNAVPYGTELTIVATPDEGSELTSLIAGGINITETKKVTIKKETTIEAVFTMQSFAVKLTKEGEGTISATGADDLDAVDYGTELTIVATPAAGYKLTALTANGEDILATKSFVVKGATEVKATFEKKSFAVTFDKVGEGTITATGADDLNAVAYGTELTIVATPAEGYELTALTANGTDILATKKIVVTDNLTIKATFEKKTFAVTLTSNEHGEITIVEPVNLKAVPYGTTLTVKATGKNAQCVLTELTANGENILATQSFVVKGATEVKATFVDHTGVETTVTQQVKLYPNPATDYVIVEGVAPASKVTLHSMTGERLYADRADSRGTLRIDLTPYADGVYLVCVAGETYRVVVRH